MKLLILGAGGHGKVVKEVAEALDIYEKIDFLDDNSQEAVGKISDMETMHGTYDAAFVGIGNNAFRNELLKKLDAIGYTVPVIIHPTAYISKTAQIGKGTVVEPKTIINANSVVGNGCIISVGSIVDHDVVLEDCVHVNAGAICMAGSRVAAFNRVDAGQVVKGY